ncbi:unnamed protein product [Cylindrotheca closterium]|uniref:Uncharacterized protein n=1 Tax=Cylindrotheca closterium TaxID=2856 RepID=A0AAD2FTK8_9STRA|nr:unnamed protein product [Cylindrotheca closterium]
MWRPAFLFPETSPDHQEETKKVEPKKTSATASIGRPSFLFPELQIPVSPRTEDENKAPVGESIGEFQLELESDDEWESVEDIKFDMPDDINEGSAKKRSSSQSWMGSKLNSSTSSISACSTVSLEDALKDSGDFQGDSGDLDFDMGDRWKTALKESLDQPLFIDFERNVRKEAIRKLGKKNRRKLGKKKKDRPEGLRRHSSEPDLFPSDGARRRNSEPNLTPSVG